jgi:nitrate reductase assembly molybdenum cofactor insertion protein NarJ
VNDADFYASKNHSDPHLFTNAEFQLQRNESRAMPILSASRMWLEAFIFLLETAQHSIYRAADTRIHRGFRAHNLSSYYKKVGAG